jgi:hypothetical protein
MGWSLNADEREQLEALIRKGKSPAQRLLKARIVLEGRCSEASTPNLRAQGYLETSGQIADAAIFTKATSSALTRLRSKMQRIVGVYPIEYFAGYDFLMEAFSVRHWINSEVRF